LRPEDADQAKWVLDHFAPHIYTIEMALDLSKGKADNDGYVSIPMPSQTEPYQKPATYSVKGTKEIKKASRDGVDYLMLKPTGSSHVSVSITVEVCPCSFRDE